MALGKEEALEATSARDTWLCQVEIIMMFMVKLSKIIM